jgi:hypothetical protein
MNPIPKHDLWATKTIAEIQDYIELFRPNNRADLYHIMMLTLNACHKLVNDAEVKDEQ